VKLEPQVRAKTIENALLYNNDKYYKQCYVDTEGDITEKSPKFDKNHFVCLKRLAMMKADKTSIIRCDFKFCTSLI
ncbi:hypothetical protein PS6_009245, partial [Mucor atramentarius]